MSVKKYIPNAITSLNLVCGVTGIWFAFVQGDCRTAFYLMLAAVVFDFCDGLAARLLGAWSEIGKQLDSLSDLVSFGVLPAAIMMTTYSHMGLQGSILYWVPVVLALFSAIRLAKFNVDERQHESFVGLPTPASALICASLCFLLESYGAPVHPGKWLIPATALVLSFLLVCELPMFSFKYGKDIQFDPLTRMKRTALISISAIIVVMVVLFALPWPAIILGIFLVYILENALFELFAPKKD